MDLLDQELVLLRERELEPRVKVVDFSKYFLVPSTTIYPLRNTG